MGFESENGWLTQGIAKHVRSSQLYAALSLGHHLLPLLFFQSLQFTSVQKKEKETSSTPEQIADAHDKASQPPTGYSAADR